MTYPNIPSLVLRTAILLCTIAIGTISSCSKSSSTSVNADSTTQLLTASRWNSESYQLQQQNGTWIADPNPPASYFLTFSANSQFSILQGVVTLSGYTWYIGTGLVLTGSFLEGTYTINQLTSTTLEITEQNYPTGGTYTGERITFSH